MEEKRKESEEKLQVIKTAMLEYVLDTFKSESTPDEKNVAIDALKMAVELHGIV